MRYVTFLRAINVGSHNRIRMDELRTLVAATGCEDVSTYLQTGNILFTSALPRPEIGPAIEEALVARGLRNAAAVVRSRDELAAILAGNPFGDEPEAEGINRMITLFRDALPAAAGDFRHERFEVVEAGPAHVCWRIPRGGQAGFDPNSLMECHFKTPGTTRYWHVVAETARLLDV